MARRKENKEPTIGIWFELDEESNRLLEASATANGRTKKLEARLRLKDHLRKFKSKINFTEIR